MRKKTSDNQRKKIDEKYQKYAIDSYIKYAGKDIQESDQIYAQIENFCNTITRLRVKLDKSIKKVKLPLFSGSAKKTYDEIVSIEEILIKLPKSFQSSIDKNKNLLADLISKHQSTLAEYDPGEILYMLSLVYGGYEKLHEAIKTTPSLAPIGFNKNTSAESLRLKAYRYHKKPCKNLKST